MRQRDREKSPTFRVVYPAREEFSALYGTCFCGALPGDPEVSSSPRIEAEGGRVEVGRGRG